MKQKKGFLAHRPLPKTSLKPLTAKEELEIAKDLALSSMDLYDTKEIADLVRRQIISLADVEDVLSPSNA